MLVMYSSYAFSFKILCVLSTFFPGVLLLYSPYFASNVVRECEKISLVRAAKTDRYVREVEGAVQYMKLDWELKELEIQNNQRPFECISDRIHGRRIGQVESTPEYQNLKQRCELQQGRVQCDPFYPYRSINGTCNNLSNVKWGSIETCVKRISPENYEGTFGFRRSVCRTTLPNPRVLSLNIFKTKEILSQDLNTIFVFFAQLVAHDIVDTPDSASPLILEKCRYRRRHPQCANIYIPPNDPYYTNVTWLSFLRSAPCGTCSLGKRNTMIRTTSFIDLSFVYGITEIEAKNLRKNDGTGKLRVQETDVGDLLPPDFRMGNFCGSLENHEYCFKAGDERVNQHTSLSNFQTIFLREHNRIAEILKQLNPHWSDEKLYQETRKIVIAEFQVIIYKELIPLLLEPSYISSFGLAISDGWSVYNPLVDPSMYAEFTFAAFRLHSLIPTEVTKLGADGGKKNLQDFVKESVLPIYHGEMENMLHGMCSSASGTMDKFTTHEITDSLLKSGDDPGIDLLAVDIHRGRDVGMSPYTDVIRYLSNGRKNIRTFKDLEKIFQPQDVELLKSLYCDVRDIDYFVGMHFEPHANAAVWGSAAKIVARQFSNLKFGDRFFFEHFGNFNKAQLRSLKEVTLASILCDNTNLPFIQENAMKFKSARNPVLLCKDIPKLNLEFWKADSVDIPYSYTKIYAK